MTPGPAQHTVLAPDDGSLGPLLRVSDDRLARGRSYGSHEHARVDVVAVVLAGSLHHRWGDGARMAPGDVAVLRAGTGLVHDEAAGDDGARVLQCYLRPARPAAEPSHEVHRGVTGRVGLHRPDAELWVVRAAPGVPVDVPAGLLLRAGTGTTVVRHSGGPVVPDEQGTLLLWQLETGRPAWADDGP
ncbi:pirin family protein [Blastococcus goldschmidtiae]|uniref:Pirin family protein n=1 Tax=Blastococcus goldschmidtiae TaxID=3075546 RepID=A0ABU2K7L0_9ACTN|nr:pirin family protein [Blastococcus sp. DSM 46792]MDT0276179.1 pirin family protein [Blastococcus sp. DSM 46792]